MRLPWAASTTPSLLAAAAMGLAGCGDEITRPDPPIDPPPPGFRTSQPLLARPLAGSLEALVTVGDTLPGSGAVWAPIPDGIGGFRDDTTVVVFVNHELPSNGVPVQGGGRAFEGARVSRLILHATTGDVLAHSYPVDGSEGYRTLCSASWADADSGFPAGVLFSGEEATDGLQLALDRDGRVTEMPWIGRFAHENLVPVPGYAPGVALVGLDDRAARSELYLYTAASAADALSGRGTLYVLTVEVPDPSELAPGLPVAAGWRALPDVRDFSADRLQREVEDLGAFPFVRLEDGDIDRRGVGGPPALYIADTGSELVPNTAAPWDPFGSIYRLELDPVDAAGPARLILLARSDGPASGWTNPDNVGTSPRSLMVQEDPSAGAFLRPARIYRFGFAADGSLEDPAGTPVVELVDDSCPRGGGCNESSGIVSAEHLLGPGRWLFAVQGHEIPVPRLELPGENGQLLILDLPGS